MAVTEVVVDNSEWLIVLLKGIYTFFETKTFYSPSVIILFKIYIQPPTATRIFIFFDEVNASTDDWSPLLLIIIDNYEEIEKNKTIYHLQGY